MLDLMAEAAGGQVLVLDLEERAVAILRAHAHLVRARDDPVAPGDTQAALQPRLLALGGDDLRIDEFNDLALAVHDDANAAQYADLRRGKTDAAGFLQRFRHVVQQRVQPRVELRHVPADLFEQRVAALYDFSDCHHDLP